MLARAPRSLALAVLAAVSAGCASEYHSHAYVPARIDVPVEFPDPPLARAHASARVVGVRKADEELGLTDQVEIEMEVENTGDVPLDWGIGQCELEVGGGVSFAPVRLARESGSSAAPEELSIRLDPGQRAAQTLAFPRPAERRFEDLDLSELELAWILAFDAGRRVESRATFHRWVRGPGGHHFSGAVSVGGYW